MFAPAKWCILDKKFSQVGPGPWEKVGHAYQINLFERISKWIPLKNLYFGNRRRYLRSDFTIRKRTKFYDRKVTFSERSHHSFILEKGVEGEKDEKKFSFWAEFDLIAPDCSSAQKWCSAYRCKFCQLIDATHKDTCCAKYLGNTSTEKLSNLQRSIGGTFCGFRGSSESSKSRYWRC